jgi:predicted TIM-barrel fold metal-dependent hydrolase
LAASSDTGAHAAHRYPAERVDYARGRGATKVLLGTDYPMLTADQGLARLDELGLDNEQRDLYPTGNARRIFRL